MCIILLILCRPKSTLFSSGGHTGGIRVGVNSSFPSYEEMINKVGVNILSQEVKFKKICDCILENRPFCHISYFEKYKF